MDLSIVKAVQSISTKFGDFFMKTITHFGDVFVLAGVFLILYYMVNKKYAVDFIVATGVVLGFSYALKKFIKRPRPYNFDGVVQKSYADGYSFPSGHSTTVASISSGVILANRKNKKCLTWSILLCSILSLLVGLSRIYLGVHYLTDVITGLFLGSVLTSFIIFLLNKFNYTKILNVALIVISIVGICVFYKELFVKTEETKIILVLGAMLGLGIGMMLEERFVKLDISKIQNRKQFLWVPILSIVEVVGLFLLLNLIPKFGIILFFEIAIICFFATYIQMLIMKAIYKKLGVLC